MLISMTAFAKADIQTNYGVVSWEVRCVNHRFLDPHFRLHDQFASLEGQLRDSLKQYLARGRCDVFMRFTPKVTTENLHINESLAAQLINQLKMIADKHAVAFQYSGLELLRFPGIMQMPSNEDETMHKEILQSFQTVLTKLVADRQREGSQIQQLLLQRLQQIADHFVVIKQRVPALLPQVEQKIITALQNLKSELNQDRLEQELVYLANKIDVQEECDRFMTHLQELTQAITTGGTIGRRLDFLLQEIQREINTLGNKANDRSISQAVVDIKVLIEQIREQVQNVE